MRHRLSLVSTIVFVASLGLVLPSQPASADTDVCAFQAGYHTSTGLGYPVVTPKTTANFVFKLTLGSCMIKTHIDALGTVNGWCGLATGNGTTDNGHDFVFQNTGTISLFTGELVGVASHIPDPFTTINCAGRSEIRFLLTGAFLKVHCTATVLDLKNKDLNTQLHLCF